MDEEDKSDSGFIEEPFEFYVDKYSDEKIKEIISIFRNDFKTSKKSVDWVDAW